MHWQAKMKNGTMKCHVATDLHGPAASHHSLDPAQVVRFDLIEGNQSVWGMDGMPRNVRKRPSLVNGKRGIEVYVILLASGVVIVRADGKIITLPDFLPPRMHVTNGGFGAVEWLTDDFKPTTLSSAFGVPVVRYPLVILLDGRLIVDAGGNMVVDGAPYPELYPWCGPFNSHPVAAWDASREYVAGNHAVSGGNVFTCIADCKGVAPSDAKHWAPNAYWLHETPRDLRPDPVK